MGYISNMLNDVVEIAVKAVIPMANGTALFLGSPQKTFLIHIDPTLGNTIAMAIKQIHKERPMTHDLIYDILGALGANIERCIINDTDGGTFFARLILNMSNELGTKVVEADSRPSDAIVLCLQSNKPIYVTHSVLNKVEDVTQALQKIMDQEEEKE